MLTTIIKWCFYLNRCSNQYNSRSRVYKIAFSDFLAFSKKKIIERIKVLRSSAKALKNNQQLKAKANS
jgi:hypothetical protein